MDNPVTDLLADTVLDHLSHTLRPRPLVAEPQDAPPAAPGGPGYTKTLRCQDRIIDRREGIVIRGSSETSYLSPTELRLLNYLADRPNQVVDRDALWGAVWHQEPTVQSRAIDKTVRRLRTKIERDPANPTIIESVYGVGYRLNLGPDEARVGMTIAPPGLVARSSDGALIGREAELRALVASVGEGLAHLLLVGPAGVGKSRLALTLVRALAAEHGLRCEGAIDLAGVDDERGAVERIAAHVGADAPEDVAALCRHLATLGPCSLLLDDVEGVAELVRDVMRRSTVVAPDLRLIVTSRFALGSRCARVVLIEPLGVGAAMELFFARARRAAPPALKAWSAPDAIGLVEALVERLDRLPLAIELAAARTSVMSPHELTAHLDRRFDLLRDPLGREVGRHASLRAALDVSWSLITPADREVLVRCSAFRGPFSLSAAQEAIGLSAGASVGALLDTLHRLVAHSLIASLRDDSATPQLVLLECVRDYALERGVADDG